MEIRHLADSFQIALAARNLSPRTVKTYLDSVGLFAGYLERSGMPTRLDAITREHVEAFIAAELERVSPTSVHIRYRGLQQFFKWAIAIWSRPPARRAAQAPGAPKWLGVTPSQIRSARSRPLSWGIRYPRYRTYEWRTVYQLQPGHRVIIRSISGTE